MNLEARLKRVVDEDPDKYSPESIMRVHQFILWTEEHPNKRRQWNAFDDIEDFKLYYNTDPSLKDKERGELANGPDEIGRKFYNAIALFFERKKIRDKKQKEDLLMWFPKKKFRWTTFTTIKEFKDAYNSDPNLKGKASSELQENKDGGSAFYAALYKLCKKLSKGDKKVKEKLMEWIPTKLYNWFEYTTIEHFKREYNNNPLFKGKFRSEIANDTTNGGSRFYSALKRFCNNESKGDTKKKDELMSWLPESDIYRWKKFTKIEQFKIEYETNNHLRGKTGQELSKDTRHGGKAFHSALGRFCRKESKRQGIDRAELLIWLPYSTKAPKYDFGRGQLRFGSNPERIVGMILNKYGLLKRPEEGINVHVMTNGNHQHNLDFLTGNTFIEYHPLSIGEKKKGLTFEDVFDIRWNNITNPEYQQHWFWMFEDINDLHYILQDPEIKPLMNKKYQNLTYNQFKDHVNEAYDKAREYDQKQEVKKQKAELNSILKFSYDFMESIYPTRETPAANDDIELADEVAA